MDGVRSDHEHALPDPYAIGEGRLSLDLEACEDDLIALVHSEVDDAIRVLATGLGVENEAARSRSTQESVSASEERS